MEPVPDLRERNLGAIFDTILDADGDSIITSADFSRLAQGVCAQLGIQAGQKAAAISQAYLSWWEQLSRTSGHDRDGQVTRAEFTGAHLTGQGNPQAYYEEQVSSLMRIIGDALDTDGDGFIEQAQYIQLFGLASLPAEAVAAGFARLDRDGDGRISIREWNAGATHAFLSGDPQDPGTAMLGLT
jgi:hypothetical protein